ncbi:hypothetical protein H2200_007468 [Cladophialophora chaetospira]|uniref:Uncharacterized protein n=1 Tax=Cladophialophora chaetospira TaxID=386627 RepID=A0AA38X7U6_9EURO|nr:hypothetical protein H2200_007468 [Cladophialophora chaetospira]
MEQPQTDPIPDPQENGQMPSLQRDEAFEDLDKYDEELIKQWSQSTCYTLSDRPDLITTWQVTVPGLALTHAFLRHGLLAHAALHIRDGCPQFLKPLYFNLAARHQQKALGLYIPELKAITPDNCHALFAFSAVLPGIQYASLPAYETETGSPAGLISRIVSVFEYLIGATVVATQGAVWIRQGAMEPLMTIRKIEDITSALLPEPRDALNKLKTYIGIHYMESSTPDDAFRDNKTRQAEDTRRTYLRSIEMLSNAFPTHDSQRRYLDALIGWPTFVGADFIRSLKACDPLALVVLAHYGVALNGFRDVWWLGDLGARLIKSVAQTLSPELLPLIEWPLAMPSADDGTMSLDSRAQPSSQADLT